MKPVLIYNAEYSHNRTAHTHFEAIFIHYVRLNCSLIVGFYAITFLIAEPDIIESKVAVTIFKIFTHYIETSFYTKTVYLHNSKNTN